MTPSPPAPSPRSARRVRPLLLAAAALLFAAPFLAPEPAAGGGASRTPWEAAVSAGAATGVLDLVVWAACALGAAAVGFGLGGLRALAALTAAAVLLAARVHGLGASLPDAHPDPFRLAWAALSALLAGAGWAAASSQAPSPRRAAGALFGAAAGMAFVLALWAEAGGSGVGREVAHGGQVWRGLLRGAELDDDTRLRMARDLWTTLVPHAMQVVAIGAALALSLRLSRDGRASERGARLLGAIVALLMVGGALLPIPASLGLFGDASRRGFGSVATAAAAALVEGGLAVGLLLAALTVAWLRAPRPALPEPGALAPPRRGSPRWPFAVAGVLLVAQLLAAHNPSAGFVGHEWPWEAVAGSPWGQVALAVIAATLSAAILALAAWRPGSPRLRWLAAVVPLLVAAVLIERKEDFGLDTYAVDPWVSVVLAASVGGVALFAPRGPAEGVGRLVAGAAGAVLVALVVYPLLGAADATRITAPGWRSGSLPLLVEGLLGGGPARPTGASAAGWGVQVAGHLAMGVLALWWAARGGGWVVRTAMLLAWGFTLLFPAVRAAIDGAGGPTGDATAGGGAVRTAVAATAGIGYVALALAWSGWLGRADSAA